MLRMRERNPATAPQGGDRVLQDVKKVADEAAGYAAD